MSIMDARLLLCESMSIAASAAGSTDSNQDPIHIPQVLDHKGVAGNDRPNVSQRLNLNIVVEDEDMLAAVDGSIVTFELYNDTDDTTVTTDGDVIATQIITENDPTEHPDGTQICSIPLPVGQLKPYFQLKIGVATQDLSTGKITAWLGGPIQQGQ